MVVYIARPSTSFVLVIASSLSNVLILSSYLSLVDFFNWSWSASNVSTVKPSVSFINGLAFVPLDFYAGFGFDLV